MAKGTPCVSAVRVALPVTSEEQHEGRRDGEILLFHLEGAEDAQRRRAARTEPFIGQPPLKVHRLSFVGSHNILG